MPSDREVRKMSLLQAIQINIESILLVLCVAIWLITFIGEKDDKQPYRFIWGINLLTAGLLLSDILAMVYRGNVTSLGYYMVRIANFSNFTFLYGMILYVSFLVERFLDKPQKGKARIFISKLVAGFALVINCLNLCIPIMYDFDERNKYFRLNGWYATSACVLIAIALLSSVMIQSKEDLDISLFYMLEIDIVMPLLASIVQVFIYGIAITNIAIGLTQIVLFMILYIEQVRKIKERDIQIEEYNAKIMLTQVQPHFMLNTLSTIQYLCKSDSDAAYETISDFGVYLRNNMDFAVTTTPILFERELAHIEKYIAIEQKRFGDRINVKYDIKERDFELPALSVQPLVENAIKHGISKKRKGGTVEISTWKGTKDIHVIVSDDGKGFDINEPFSTDRVHLGISLVRSRLKSLCGGNLIVNSEPDKGTICEIIIPIEFE